MTDIFAQEGITFEHAGFASTAPSGTPEPLDVPQVSVSDLHKAIPKSGPMPPPDPQTIIPPGALAGQEGAAVSGAPGAAPPQEQPDLSPDIPDVVKKYAPKTQNGAPSAPKSSPRDIFQEMGIDPHDITGANYGALNSGIPLGTKNTFGNAQPDPQVQQTQQYAKEDMDQVMTLAKMRFSQDQIDQWRNNPITFAEAFQKLHADQVVPLGGLHQLYDAGKITLIANKAQNGEQLTPEDQATLNKYLDEQIEMRIRGFTRGGNIAYVGAQIPAFALEFAATDGVGKAAQVAAKEAAAKVAEKAALSTAVGWAARIATQTALMPGQYLPKYGERRLNDISAITDKGDLVLRQSTESPAMSALMAYGHTSADVAGQLSAGAIGSYVIDPAKNLVSTPLVSAVNSLSPKLKTALYDAYKAIQPNAKVSQAFTAMGWRGMLEQLGANRVTQVLNSTLDYGTDQKMTFDQYLDHLTPSKDQLMVEGGLVGIAGGIHTSASVAFNIMRRRGVPSAQAQETVDNMTALERDNFVADNLPTPKSDIPHVDRGNLAETERAPYLSNYEAILGAAQDQRQAPKSAQPDAQAPSVVQTQPKDTQTAPAAPGEPANRILEIAKENGLDPKLNTPESLYEALGPEPEIKEAAAKLGYNITDRDAVEIRTRLNDLTEGDTRGMGQQYHGTSTPIDKLSDNAYSSLNYYGQGLYTTDAYDVAKGYSKKGRGKEPTIYSVQANEAQRRGLFDMERDLNDADWKALKLPKELTEARNSLKELGNDTPNLRQIYDEARDLMTQDGNSADTIQEVFDAARYQLEAQKYTGLKHTGGLRTKTKSHTVEIYWNPSEGVDLGHTDLKSLIEDQIKRSGNETLMDQPNSVFFDGDVTKGQNQAAEKADPPPINNEESTFNWLARAFFNRWNAAEEPYKNAVKSGYKPKRMENTPLLMSLANQTPELVRSHIMINTFKWDENGNIVKTGKSLKAILDDFDNYFLTKEPNRVTRKQDFNDYLIARHYLSLLEKAPHILVTDEQKAKSAQDLAKLSLKYGEDMRMMESLGNEIVGFRNRTRDLLVGNLLTEEQRAVERELFPYSIPLKREIDPKQYEAAIARGDYASLNPGNLTKHLKGSALPVKDILHSILRDTARTIDFVMRNRVNNSIYDLKDFVPDKVQETQVPYIKVGKADFHVAYDPKLREKLTTLVGFLGGRVKRDFTVEGAPRGTLGSYTNGEGLVRLRLGTTEGTLAHEAGHMLDDKVGLGRFLLQDTEIHQELKNLAKDRLSSVHLLEDTEEGMHFKEQYNKHGKKYERYIMQNPELIANFFDTFVNSPEKLDTIAPRARDAFQAFIEDNPQLAFLNEIKPSTNRGMEKITKDVYGPGDLPANTIALWRDGQKKYVQVAKPMFESLSDMRPSQVSSMARFMNATIRLLSMAHSLTTGATATPEFGLRNVVRDAGEATVQSGVGYNPLFLPKSLFGMLTNSEEYKQFKMAGGKFGSFMALDDGNIEKSFEDILDPKSLLHNIVRHPIESWEKIPKATETLGRFGVFRAALQKGYSPIEAAQFDLDATLNFPRGGFITKKVNQFTPFLNVGFLATERLVRGFVNDPMTMGMRGVSYITAPALLVAGYYLYGADEQTRQEYLELPREHVAEGRVYFKYNGEWRYIPTPYAIGYLFSGLPQMALRTIHGDNPDNGKQLWQELLKGFVGAVSPINDWSSLIPPTVKVAIEDITNYDFYRERPLYSKFKEGPGVLPMDKTNAYDTETAKLLGKLFNVSPAILDHSIYGLFGGSGGYALKASDYAINTLRKAQGQDVPEKPKTGADQIGVSAFTVRAPEGTRSNSYQGFTQNLLNAQAIAGHLKGMQPGQEKADYQRENAIVLSQLPQLKNNNKVIENRLKQIRAIYQDPHMSSESKVERIAVLEKEITRIARYSNAQYNSVTNAGK